ncbi:hypothetical protein [Lysinibacillus fusiformis]|uniref:hypothetical protein n=1 Tax=Lysinibacillus fusiformis TaxID=28031 RepID=UPI00301A7D75
MNFDTKYLIRWGIPGWIMILTLFPYFFVTYIESFKKIFELSAVDILTIGAALTFLGVPLGYVLNQVHHTVLWVIPRIRWKRKKWDEYFKQEVLVDKKMLTNDNFDKERYRYLLSKKHEIGGVTASFVISWLIIIIINISYNSTLWSWIYFGVVSFLTALFLISRDYSSRNVHYYFYEYLLEESKSR